MRFPYVFLTLMCYCIQGRISRLSNVNSRAMHPIPYTRMTDQSPDYIVFLLRLWRVKADDGVHWRASLEASDTGERQGFADVDRLCAYLEEQCRGQPANSPVQSQ
jgi:hypothetical protein